MAMDLEELLEALHSPVPGSANHELTKMLIQARIAERERDAARDAVRWARLQAFGTMIAAIIAVVAFLVSIL